VVSKLDLTTHCACCGEKLATTRSGLAPAWCGYDFGPAWEPEGDRPDQLCKCEGRRDGKGA
jgi:hypothetical protein